MGDRRHRDHRNGDGLDNFTEADLAKALKEMHDRQQNIKLEFEFERQHAPLSRAVCGTVVVGNKVKLFAVGGMDHVTELARDLFLRYGVGGMTPEECIAKSREFYATVSREAVRAQAEAAAQQAQEPQQEDGEQGSGNIIVP